MMQDEIWMRSWNDGHAHFTADMDKALTAASGWIGKRFQRTPEAAASDAAVNPIPHPPAAPC